MKRQEDQETNIRRESDNKSGKGPAVRTPFEGSSSTSSTAHSHSSPENMWAQEKIEDTEAHMEDRNIPAAQ